MSEGLVERITHIDSPDVPIPGPTQIVRANVVRMDRAIHHRANRRGTHQEAVVIVVHVGIIAVVMETEFRGVALAEKILNVQVGYINLLSPPVE